VAVSKSEGVAMLFEVKWSDLDMREAKSLLASLERKAVELEVGEKIYGIIARNIEDKNQLRKKGYLAYDLSDIYGLLKSQ
jgi:hypothetical protein